MSTKLKVTIVVVLLSTVASLAIWDQQMFESRRSITRTAPGPRVEEDQQQEQQSQSSQEKEPVEEQNKASSLPTSDIQAFDSNSEEPEDSSAEDETRDRDAQVSEEDPSSPKTEETKQTEETEEEEEGMNPFQEVGRITHSGETDEDIQGPIAPIDSENISEEDNREKQPSNETQEDRLETSISRDDTEKEQKKEQKKEQNSEEQSEKEKQEVRSEPDQEWPKTYTIQKNDSLWKVSKSFYGTGTHWKRIYSANKDVLPNSTTLPVDRELRIPAPPEREQTASEDGSEQQPPFQVDNPDRWYKFKKGDRLWDVAKKQLGSGTRYNEILKLNKERIEDPEHIRSGTWLLLPETNQASR